MLDLSSTLNETASVGGGSRVLAFRPGISSATGFFHKYAMAAFFDFDTVMNAELPQIRARLLQLAAQLDRLDRADGKPADDPRAKRVREAINILAQPEAGRAEKIQLVFSLPYAASWKQSFGLDKGRPPEVVDGG